MAELLYRGIRGGGNAFFEGSLDSNGKIEINNIEFI